MDLARYDTRPCSEEGMELAVRPPGGGVLPGVRLLLAGIDSERYRKCERKLSSERRKGPQQRSDEDVENEMLALVVACTLGWSGVGLDSESDLPFSEENAWKLYQRLPWLRDQALVFLQNRANFLKASATT